MVYSVYKLEKLISDLWYWKKHWGDFLRFGSLWYEVFEVAFVQTSCSS